MNLNDLVNKKEDERAIIVTISNKIGNTSYQVKDSRGRRFSVEGDPSFIVGQTVTVKKGIIIGKNKSLKSFKEFVV
jgi:hypothetical protein